MEAESGFRRQIGVPDFLLGFRKNEKRAATPLLSFRGLRIRWFALPDSAGILLPVSDREKSGMQLLVLAMHRSGTSMVARLLNMLGAYFGPEGMSTGMNEENQKGFWERKDFRAFNDSVLRSAGGDWDQVSALTPEALGPLPEGSEQDKKLKSLILDLDAHRPWFLKEPRLCFTLGTFRHFLDLPVCLHVVRNPVEIAKSLRTRNGFSMHFGIALWETYTRRALAASSGLPRVWVDHHELLADPVPAVGRMFEQLEKAGVRGLSLPADREILSFVSPDLYRAKSSLESIPAWLSGAQQELWHWISSSSRLDGDPDLEPSELASELIQQTEASRALSAENESLLAEKKELETAKEELETALATSGKTAEELGREHAAALAQVQELTGQREAVETRLSGASSQLESLQAEFSQTAEALREAEARDESLGTELAQTAQALEEARARDKTLEDELAKTGKALDEARARGDLLEERLEVLTHRSKDHEKLKASHESALRNIKLLKEKYASARAAHGALRKRLSDEAASSRVLFEQRNGLRAELQQIGQTVGATGTEVSHRVAGLRESYVSLLGHSRGQADLASRVFRAIEELEGDIQTQTRQLQNHQRVQAELQAALNDTQHLATRLSDASAAVMKSLSWKLGSLVTRIPALLMLKTRARADRFIQRIAGKIAYRADQNAKLLNPDEQTSPESAPGRFAYLRDLHGIFNREIAAFPGFEAFGEMPSVAICILNLNGADHLRQLFASFTAHNTYPNFRFLVTDHASTDDSRAVLEHWQRQLPITTVFKAQNDTFSDSNNQLAEHSSAELVLFLNNDIVFVGDALTEMVHEFLRANPAALGIAQLEGFDGDQVSGIHHLGIQFETDPQHQFIRPHNVVSHQAVPGGMPSGSVSAVTGSAMMVRRQEFLAQGGFFSGFVYGYEDVDLCLNLSRALGRPNRVLNRPSLLHADGATRKKVPSAETVRQRKNNIQCLWERWGPEIRRDYYRGLFQDYPGIRGRRTCLAFAVTEVGHTAAGDLFTAQELGNEIKNQFGWRVVYLPISEWYELRGIDFLVTMRDDYDLTRIQGASPHLVKIGWARNWFDRWAGREWIEHYDLLLASSAQATDYLNQATGLGVEKLQIATNPLAFFDTGQERTLDYVFTGSYWKAEREIMSFLDPGATGLKGAVYGKGWDDFEPFKDVYRGFLNYEQLPAIYARSKIVIDDANHVTKPWGSTNSRVFDAIASGCLVLSNSPLASKEAFDGELPTYDSEESLRKLLVEFSSNEPRRRELVERLQRRVFRQHTYEHRAGSFFDCLKKHLTRGLRIAMKIPVPDRSQSEQWGDYHFASALAKELRRLGNLVRIDFLPEWERTESFMDDVVLVFRGLSRYQPRTGQLNLMWNISHPDKVSVDEYNEYDHVFVASESYAETLAAEVATPVSPLLQCADPERFTTAASDDPQYRHRVLFVGNSRKQKRKIVMDAVEADLDLEVYGTLWGDIIDPRFWRGENIPNRELSLHYAGADVILNDHWPDMAAKGFVSNRLFDVALSGRPIVSDRCVGMESVFGDAVTVYDDAGDIQDAVRRAQAIDPAVLDELRRTIAGEHSFARRAATIQRVLTEVMSARGRPSAGAAA